MKKLNKEEIETLHELIKEELIKKIRYTYMLSLRFGENEIRKQNIESYRKEWNEYNNKTTTISTDEKIKRLHNLEQSNEMTLKYLKENEMETTFLIFKKLKDYEKQIKEIIELGTKEKNEKVKIEIERKKIDLELKKTNLELKKKKLNNENETIKK